jgi:chromosome segregation ATPase
MKERVKTMMGPDGRLIDYDESYQVQRKGETVETKLDDATADFLRSFRVQQASEMIDALRECGRAMSTYVGHTQRYLQEFQQSIQAVGNQIAEVAGFTIQSLKESHRRDLQELREYIDALEEDNTRLNAQLNRARSILAPPEDGSPSGGRVAVGSSAVRPGSSRPSAVRD